MSEKEKDSVVLQDLSPIAGTSGRHSLSSCTSSNSDIDLEAGDVERTDVVEEDEAAMAAAEIDGGLGGVVIPTTTAQEIAATGATGAAAVRMASTISARAEVMYNRYSKGRKALISVILALCGILSPIATTGCLTALHEISSTFHTSGSIINISNGLFSGAMGVSAFVWGVTGMLGGRRIVMFTSVITFFCFSLGCALAPNLVAFFIFRILSGFSGTGLMVCGPTIIGDLYRPTERASALAWVMSGTIIGPAFGPLIGGAIVTYSSWRNIYWFQTGLAGLATVLSVCFIPETAHTRKWDSIPKGRRFIECTSAYNPWRLFVLFSRADLLLVAIASSSLLWNMYAFMAPIVYVINPRLHFHTPLQSGLFYLAPGCGYLTGTFFGGRYADHVVRKWIRRRGVRVPSDRLRAALVFMGVITPICMLIYGWCLDKNRGGVALPAVVMFIQGFSQTMIFPALNTFCLGEFHSSGSPHHSGNKQPFDKSDVVPGRATEVLGGNYFIRYLFGAAGTSLALPTYHGIGIGWLCTISTCFILVATFGLLLVIFDKLPHAKKDDVSGETKAEKKKEPPVAETAGKN